MTEATLIERSNIKYWAENIHYIRAIFVKTIGWLINTVLHCSWCRSQLYTVGREQSRSSVLGQIRDVSRLFA